MRVGFTGTQHGCTMAQKRALHKVLMSLPMTEFHHGDCIGADSQAHHLLPPAVPIFIHPGIVDASRRAFCKSAMVVATYQPKPPLDRNKLIVDFTEALVACPQTMEEEHRSGTWSTVRYARKLGRSITLLFPDGTMKKEGADALQQ